MRSKKGIIRRTALLLCLILCVSKLPSDLAMANELETEETTDTSAEMADNTVGTSAEEEQETDDSMPDSDIQESDHPSDQEESENTAEEFNEGKGEPEEQISKESENADQIPEKELISGEEEDLSVEADLPEDTIAAAAATCISEDRAVGVAQIQTIIPDYNFAAAVYDSLAAEGHLGTDGQTVKEVLGSFQGEINANGYVKKTEYTVTALRINRSTFETENISQIFGTQEEAQAYYDSLVDSPEYVYKNKKIDGPAIIQTTELKNENEMIKDISGIEWLREASKIDISFNKIESLMPLDFNHLAELTAEAGELGQGKKWFGTVGNNTYFVFGGNPIRHYPVSTGGRVVWESMEAKEFELPGTEYITIKADGADKVYSLDIKIPEIKQGNPGERIVIAKDPNATNIRESDCTIEGIRLVEENLTDEIFPVTGITYSGDFWAIVGTAKGNAMGRYGASPSDSLTYGSGTPKFLFNQVIRIYTEIKAEKPKETNAAITLEKTVEGSRNNQGVKGAKYQLYKATIQDGIYTAAQLVDDSVYTTDDDGKITIDRALEPGDYCLVEMEAPAGFVLDTTPLGFSVGSGTVTLSGGQNTVTPTDGEMVEAGENSTYIDRYSPDVSLTITPDGDSQLKEVFITYFDRASQDFQTVTCKDASEAEAWINANKGNEDGPGIIDGSVTVKAVFSQQVALTHTNKRSTTDFNFKKVSETDNTEMEGVEFSLSCTHVHDEVCGGDVNPESCTHAHNDTEGNITPEGCCWRSTASSDGAGLVKFSELTSGDYILKEESTLDGFILPRSTWEVSVNADTGEVNIQKTDPDDKTAMDFEKIENEDGTFVYYLKNKSTVPFSFTKTDEQGGLLPGAEFTLYQGEGEDRDQWNVVKGPVISDANGFVDFGQLEEGEYFLAETKAPSGFQLPTGYWKLQVQVGVDDDETLKFTAVGEVPAIKGSVTEGFEIANRRVDKLPELGGFGTAIYSVLGFGLMGCSLILTILYRRKRGKRA